MTRKMISGVSRSARYKEIRMIGKLRPQIFLAIIVLGILSGIGIWQGFNEIATGCTGGIIALGMKLMEAE